MDKERQLEARIQLTKEIMAWQEGKQDIVLELATGIGKNFNFLTIASSGDNKKILFVYPVIPLKDSFMNDLEKLGFSHLADNVELTCYASLKKYEGNTYDIIAYDECHRMCTEARLKSASKIKAKKRVLLSATLDKDAKEALSTEFEMNIFECDYDEAVERGILPEAEVDIRYTTLDYTEAKYLYKFKNTSKKLTAVDYYAQLNKSIAYWSDRWNNGKNGEPRWVLNKLLQLGSERIRWVGEYKTDFLKETIKELGNERHLVFCASKPQAHMLGGDDAVSSDNSKKLNKEIIDSFNAGERQALYAVKVLDEGLNLHDCQYGIIGALGSKELTACQRLGRILRHDSPKLIILVVANTVDEKFLEQSFGYNIYGEKL